MVINIRMKYTRNFYFYHTEFWSSDQLIDKLSQTLQLWDATQLYILSNGILKPFSTIPMYDFTGILTVICNTQYIHINWVRSTRRFPNCI